MTDDEAPPLFDEVFADTSDDGTDVSLVKRGVTVNWIAEIFRLDVKTVRHLIRGVPPIMKSRGKDVYDLRILLPHLQPPADRDLKQYIATMKKSEMPVGLTRAFWDAEIARMKAQEQAGNLWRTEDIAEALSSLLKTVRESQELWFDSIVADKEYPTEIEDSLENRINALQDTLWSDMLEAFSERGTPSALLDLKVPDGPEE